MALGGGMQDKNEVGGGMLYPCVPPLLEESFEDYTEDIGILDNLSRYEMDECIENYCKNNPKMKIHQPSKKAGRLLYNSEWDLINKVYELRSGNNYNLLSEDSERKSNLETKDMFYVAREIRNHLKLMLDIQRFYKH